MGGNEAQRTALFESPRAERRLARAGAWLGARSESRVVVLGASIEAAAELCRRTIGPSSARKAQLGWERWTLPALAASLARPELARRGEAPAGNLALEAICARIVHDGGARLGRLLPIADRPGLPRALARTIGELRLSGVTDPGDADLLALLAAFEQSLRDARLADRARVLEIAAEIARGVTKHDDALVGLDVPLRWKAEADFLAALAPPATFLTFPTGDTRAIALASFAGEAERDDLVGDDALVRLQRGLFAAETPSPREKGETVTIVSAPGESREAVEIARLVSRGAAAGTAFDRIAVLLRAPQYGAHLAEAFRRAAIPAFFARGTRKPDPSGRALLALVRCATEGLSASRFAEYLSLGEVPALGEGGAPPAPLPRGDRVAAPDEETLAALQARTTLLDDEDEPVGSEVVAPRQWERLLVEAAVIGGRGRWEARIAGLANKLRMDADAYAAKGEQAQADGVRKEGAALDTLARFALPLIADLDALPEQAPWGEWIEALSKLATRAIRDPGRVLGVLAELEPMAKVGPVSLAEVRLVLDPRLTQLLVPPPGRRYGKVFVGTIDEARGLAFEVVFVPGLAEKMFPQRVTEDPLLLDEARRPLGLPTNAERTDDERLALRLAVGAASERVVFSYPRLDVEQARPRTPSFYGLEVLRVAEGALRDFEHLASEAASRVDARIGWPAPRLRDDAIDEAEFDLAVLDEILRKSEDEAVGQAHYLLGANVHLARALRFRGRRWLKAWKASDGLVDPNEEALVAIREHAIEKRSFSPTALQNFAACPYRFLLSAVHKLAPRQDVAPIEDLDPLTRGSLVHEVQFTLLTELRDASLLPVTESNLEAARERLETVLAEVAGRFKDTLHPAIPRVWDDAIAGIAADLREWLRRAAQDPTWIPVHFELSFGLKDRRDQDAKSVDEPLELASGLRLRGSIDLVEKTTDGRLRATDHKTGKPRAKKGLTLIGGGETLQPVLYALAIEKMFPGVKIDGGRLYYCTASGGFEDVPIALDAEARAAAALVAKTIGDAIARGFLPAAPNKDAKGYSACTYCDFRSVCGPYEEIRTKRKPPQNLKALSELRRQR